LSIYTGHFTRTTGQELGAGFLPIFLSTQRASWSQPRERNRRILKDTGLTRSECAVVYTGCFRRDDYGIHLDAFLYAFFEFFRVLSKRYTKLDIDGIGIAFIHL
jgi:hypothetical protein